MAKQLSLITTARVLTAFVLALGFSLPAYSDNDEAEQQTAEIAEKVEQKAKRLEKAEGKNDLVKDEVTVKTEASGEPVLEQVGEASFYGKGFHGKKTASGETFNQNELTAAHPTLPLGSEATVTNLETGKSVEVEINDRGPYAKGRDLDVSKAAAKKLEMTEDGVAPVKIEAEIPPQEEGQDKK